jgi:hypothetical protein
MRFRDILTPMNSLFPRELPPVEVREQKFRTLSIVAAVSLVAFTILLGASEMVVPVAVFAFICSRLWGTKGRPYEWLFWSLIACHIGPLVSLILLLRSGPRNHVEVFRSILDA